MSFFGPNNYGYDPVRHDLYLYGEDTIPDADGNFDSGRWAETKGYNPNNLFIKQGYNFSCISFKERRIAQEP